MAYAATACFMIGLTYEINILCCLGIGAFLGLATTNYLEIRSLRKELDNDIDELEKEYAYREKALDALEEARNQFREKHHDSTFTTTAQDYELFNVQERNTTKK